MIITITKAFLSAPICYSLMATITVVSLWAIKDQRLFFQLLFHPSGIVRSNQFYRLFTGDLVHNDHIHLLINLIMLFTFGTRLEEYLLKTTAHGSLNFVCIYLGSCLAGNLITMARHWRQVDYTNAGASGSIIGCMLGFVLLQPDIIAFYLPVIGGVKNIYGGLMCIIAFMIYTYRNHHDNVNHEVHFFGGLGGMATTILINC